MNYTDKDFTNLTNSSDVSFVSLCCRGTKDNPHPEWRIATFERDDVYSTDTEAFWSEKVTGYRLPNVDQMLTDGPPVTAYLIDNRWVGQGEVKRDENLQAPGLRRRYHLRCKYGDVAPVTIRAERAAKYLEQLHRVGVSVVCFPDLAPILR